MREIARKNMYMALAFSMLPEINRLQSANYKHNHVNPNAKLDKIMELLIIKRICFIQNYDYERLKDMLPSKLKGLVLFHSDIKTKQTFITYQKGENK